MKPMTVALHKALLSRPTPTLFTTSRVCKTTSRLHHSNTEAPFLVPAVLLTASARGFPYAHFHTSPRRCRVSQVSHRDCCALSNLTFLSPSDDV
jgi:hypothetical protein